MKKWEIESVTVSITLWAVGATVFFLGQTNSRDNRIGYFFFPSKANISLNIYKSNCYRFCEILRNLGNNVFY